MRFEGSHLLSQNMVIGLTEAHVTWNPVGVAFATRLTSATTVSIAVLIISSYIGIKFARYSYLYAAFRLAKILENADIRGLIFPKHTPLPHGSRVVARAMKRQKSTASIAASSDRLRLRRLPAQRMGIPLAGCTAVLSVAVRNSLC
ncbi:unnamed protein product [Scytosiphon promiscuus]